MPGCAPRSRRRTRGRGGIDHRRLRADPPERGRTASPSRANATSQGSARSPIRATWRIDAAVEPGATAGSARRRSNPAGQDRSPPPSGSPAGRPAPAGPERSAPASTCAARLGQRLRLGGPNAPASRRGVKASIQEAHERPEAGQQPRRRVAASADRRQLAGGAGGRTRRISSTSFSMMPRVSCASRSPAGRRRRARQSGCGGRFPSASGTPPGPPQPAAAEVDRERV